jgi:nucleotide-binding universal stress UspA family protein
MPSIQHILFPVDFSDRCHGAVPFVEEMARRYNAKVTLLSVANISHTGGFEGIALIDPEEARATLKNQLETSFRDSFRGIQTERVAQVGDPAATIVEFADGNKVDLIMMPTHGYGPFRQMLLGSVTAKVLHDTRCPVWTTAHTGDTPDRVHLALRKLVCAVDGTEASVPLMRWAAWFAKSLGSNLRLVNAVPGIEAWPERQIDKEFEETMRQNARRHIQDLERSADIDVPVCVGAGTVPDVVREEALQHGADLVIIGRGALQSTLGRLRTHAYGIIRHAPCPVLSV